MVHYVSNVQTLRCITHWVIFVIHLPLEINIKFTAQLSIIIDGELLLYCSPLVAYRYFNLLIQRNCSYCKLFMSCMLLKCLTNHKSAHLLTFFVTDNPFLYEHVLYLQQKIRIKRSFNNTCCSTSSISSVNKKKRSSEWMVRMLSDTLLHQN